MTDIETLIDLIENNDTLGLFKRFGLQDGQARALAGRLLPLAREMVDQGRQEAEPVLRFMAGLDLPIPLGAEIERLLGEAQGQASGLSFPTPEPPSDPRLEPIRQDLAGFAERNDLIGWLNLLQSGLARISQLGLTEQVAGLTLNAFRAKAAPMETRLQANLELLKVNDPRFLNVLERDPADRRPAPTVFRLDDFIFLVHGPSLLFAPVTGWRESVDEAAWRPHEKPVLIMECLDFPRFFGLVTCARQDFAEWRQKETHVFLNPAQMMDWLRVVSLKGAFGMGRALRFFDINNIEEEYLSQHVAAEFGFWMDDIQRQAKIFNLGEAASIAHNRLLDELASRHTPRSLARIGPKFRAGKLRILGLGSPSSTYIQHNLRQLMTSFSELGCETILTPDRPNQVFGRPMEHLANVLDFDPDLVMVINRDRTGNSWVPEHLPGIWFMQDWSDAFLGIDGSDWVRKGDFIFGFHQRFKNDFDKSFKHKNKKMHLLPVCADEKLYYPVETDYRYDVSYISHAPVSTWMVPFFEAEDPVDHLCRVLSTIEGDEAKARAVGLVAYLVTPVPEIPELFWCRWTEIAPLMTDLYRKAGFVVDPEEIAGMIHRDALLTEQHAVIKVRTLQHLTRNGIHVHLFGRDWEKLPSLAPYTHGPVANGQELNLITNQTRINLNITSIGALSTRAVEIMLARSFMLTTRKVPGGHDLPEALPLSGYLEEGTEVIWCDDEADLAAKIRYYLDHPEERRELAHRAHQVALERLTTKAVAREIIETVLGEIGD